MMLALLLSALLIFAMRVTDVSLGTLRIVMLVRGRRVLAGALGFCESLIWLIAAAQVITSLDSPIKFVAYAGGYAAGTMLGATIERWIAMGNTLMRIVVRTDSPPLAPALRQKGFYATVVNAEGRDGDVRIIFSVIPRRRIPEVMAVINEINPQAYVTFEETNIANLQRATAVRK